MNLLEKIVDDKALVKRISKIIERLTIAVDGVTGNIDNRILEVVYENFERDDVINTYGELFVIEKFLGEENGVRAFLCRKLKFDMSLADEIFEVREWDECDADGEYDHTEYCVSLT